MLRFELTHGAFWTVTDGQTRNYLTDMEAEDFMSTLTAHNVSFEITAI